MMLGEEMIGIGRYDRTNDPTEAEVAFMISDAHQGRGIGSILLEHLAAAAHERGIDRFSAEVLPQNRKMLNVFTDAGYEITREFEDGLVMVHFNIDPTDRSRGVMEAREHRAEAKSIAELLAPRVVAVLGAADRWEKTGQKVITTLIQGGYTGKIYAVNEAAHPAGNLPVLENMAQIPERVDLAIIAVALKDVPAAVEACGQAGTRGVLIYTSGYADDGVRGRARQKDLVKRARSHGMRVIGPASFGILNNSPSIRLDATISSQDPAPGNLGLFSQSSAIGAVLSNSAIRRNIGVSSLISAGNRADVSGNDIMQYWEDDDATRVCTLYLESIGNPRKFSRIARRLSRVKPVVLAKNAVTGQQLPPGHSGRTAITPPSALDSMFKQAGVIRAETIERALDVAQILVSQPLPAGRRLAILSNASALGQIVADRAEELRIDVTLTETMLRLTDEDEDGLEILVAVARSALEATTVDAVIGVFITGDSINPQDVARVLHRAGRQTGKPILASFPGAISEYSTLRGIWTEAPQNDQQEKIGEQTTVSPQEGLPCFDSPGESILALGAVMDYVEWRDKETGALAAPEGVSPKAAAADIAVFLQEASDTSTPIRLGDMEAARLLKHYGISLLPEYPFDTPDQAIAAAQQAGGYPVVLKTTDNYMRHRIDLGGVRLGIENDEDLVSEIDQMHRALEPYGRFDLALQKQAAAGQTAVIKAVEDPLIGPVISFGMAGDATALLDDWAHRVPPLTERDIYKLIRSPKAASKLLDPESRHTTRTDLLEDLCSRVALMKDNHPEIADLELNPILLSSDTLTVVGARIQIAQAPQRTDSARRAMSS